MHPGALVVEYVIVLKGTVPAIQYWHPLERDWVIDAKTFDVWVGGDSTASLGATFEVTTSSLYAGDKEVRGRR